MYIITYKDDKTVNEEANPHTGDDGDILQNSEELFRQNPLIVIITVKIFYKLNNTK